MTPTVPGDLEGRVRHILRGACAHKPGEPFNADEWLLDVGELLWRGFVVPAMMDDPVDVTTADGRLSFRLTPRGRYIALGLVSASDEGKVGG